MKKVLWGAVAGLAVAAFAAGGWWVASQGRGTAPQTADAATGQAIALPGIAPSGAQARAMAPLRELLANYRKIIVLLADEAKLGSAEKAAANQAGMALFHANLAKTKELVAMLEDGPLAEPRVRLQVLPTLLDYIESDPTLFDADRLAFREVLRQWQALMARDGALPAIKLHKRMGEDLDALAEIERNYEKEIREVFGRFESRGITLKRERWDDYVTQLQRLYTREAILRDHGVVLPYPEPPVSAKGKGKAKDSDGSEFSGRELPPKTIVLTFDDGPHGTYTPEIAAILKQYSVPAVFFQVGSNLGTVGNDGKPHLHARAQVSKQLQDAGHVLANHSLTHAQLSKRSGDALRDEILVTDKLLTSVDERRSALFRFPYGARNPEGMDILSAAQMRSVMWNVDSLDWADPVPASIAQRVLSTVDKEGRGIVLFHDIHERTVKALPGILAKLVADGYQFATWDGKAFSVPKGGPSPSAAAAAAPAAVIAGSYGQSWAIVVGIDDYARWPRLQYAVRDARAVREALIQKFGFASERIVTLENKDATRANILAAFHDKLAHSGMQKNDRLFVFFAGHGATRKLTSGRDLGYIIPVDSDPQQFATDAIPMSELQNIAESVTAKHTLFVMDACYSGLGLTRGGGNANFLRDNFKRVGRQMLTAGGADQLVADGGPNGHSVFTWALLQGLGGKGDLNGDGIITATELAAYVAPAVASASSQTPAFGSLPGSEGGDFVFELPTDTEFLSAQSTQLGSEAIAMNSRLDAAQPALIPGPQLAASGATGPVPKVAAPVVIKDLQGNDQKITPPQAVALSNRQLAQRANDRGLQLYREKQYEQAEAQFTEALKLRPDFALAANNLGFIYYRQDKFVEAARWFDNTIRIDPSRAVAYLNLGDALEKAGEADRARKAYTTYLELAPRAAGADKLREKLGL